MAERESETFASRLRQLMEERGETQASVATAVGVSAQAVAKWLGGGQIDEKNLRALAQFLQTNHIWLQYGDEEIERLNLWRGVSKGGCGCRANFIMRQMDVGLWDFDIMTREAYLDGIAIHLFQTPGASTTLDDVWSQFFPDDFDAFRIFIVNAAQSNTPLTIRIRVRRYPEKWYQMTGVHPYGEQSLRVVGTIAGSVPDATV
jgi:transcriptional regulator with XRE-family HTH domain